MSLTLRPHSTNLYAFSKLLYRCNSVHPRISDLKFFNKIAKQFIYADLLIKPNELILYRDISQGGLGLTCMKLRAKAAMISSFLETAINPKFSRNNYHNQLFRCYGLNERASALKIPPYFEDDFFNIICNLNRSMANIEQISIKGVYDFLMSSILKNEIEPPAGETAPLFSEWPLKPIKCETDSPETDWSRTWRLVRQKGLGQELTSFLLKVLWKLIPTRDYLYRFLQRQYASSDCKLCPQGQPPAVETLYHALGDCPANSGLIERLLQVIRVYQPGATLRTVLTLDLEIGHSLELPMTWTIGTLLLSISTQREAGRVSVPRTRAYLESSCRVLGECRITGLENMSTLCQILVNDIFSGI